MADITYQDKQTGDQFTASNANEIKTAVNSKVDKVTGKGLSTEDYTTAEKGKLEGIANNANNYTLPTAAADTLGGIKVGARLTITDGVLSADEQGGSLTYASQAEAEAGTENTKVMTALRVFQSIAAWVLGDLTGLIVNTAISASDTIKQALGKLQGQINPLTPRTDVNFNPATGVQLDRSGGTWYNLYAQSGALNIIIEAGSIVGGQCILPITVDGNSITITGVVIDPESKTQDTISGHVDRYLFWRDGKDIYYTITNLG